MRTLQAKIRSIGPPLPYRDQAEERILEVLEQAQDRSSGSDELARQSDDWPSRYHLSPQRDHLLRPFHLTPHLRVLEIGAGTGALTRYLGETGAEVTALEGSELRAEATAARCAELENVAVLCGPLESLEDAEGFDLAVMVGVLEYAGSRAGGRTTPEALLAKARSLLRPGGALLLAIENQLGLKYLLGVPEDHLDDSWAGVAGYPGDHGIRTFARRPLGELLAGRGFGRQRWLFPFPDYKLPQVVLSEAAYLEPDAPRLVDQWVRAPLPLEAGPAPLADLRRCHRVFLDAGLGPEVAHSFLVCATGEAGDPDALLDPEVLVWRFGTERRGRWRRRKEVRRAPSGRRVEARSQRAGGEADGDTWLSQEASSESPYRSGATLEQAALDACHRGDRDALAGVLTLWSRHLAEGERPAAAEPRPAHPFLFADSRSVLPPERLDVDLSNFLRTEAGEVFYVDDEWRAVPGVDGHLARVRALWYLARNLTLSGAHHPWPATTTIDRLTAHLGELCGVEVDAAALDRFRRAEIALMSLVSPVPSDRIEESLRRLGETSQPSREDPRLGQLRQDLAQLAASLGEERRRNERRVEDLVRRLAEVDGERRATAEELERHRRHLGELEGRLSAITGSKTWRLWMGYLRLRRAVLRLVGRS